MFCNIFSVNFLDWAISKADAADAIFSECHGNPFLHRDPFQLLGWVHPIWWEIHPREGFQCIIFSLVGLNFLEFYYFPVVGSEKAFWGRTCGKFSAHSRWGARDHLCEKNVFFRVGVGQLQTFCIFSSIFPYLMFWFFSILPMFPFNLRETSCSIFEKVEAFKVIQSAATFRQSL